jgi:epoxide hydrolase-like predicted phosphatase
MIKAVIFDYGGVLVSGGGANEPAESLAAFLNISVKDAAEILSALWGDYVAGKLTEAEYWQRVEKLNGSPISGDTRTMRSTLGDVKPLPKMLTFIQELMAKKYTVGLLSNITPATEVIIREGGGYDLFEPCVLSCKVGYAKPSPEIYYELLRQLPGMQPDEIVFIDDQQRCLDPAHLLGIRTVLAKSRDQVVQDVTRLLSP